jgi:DNA invertase Pin-like site-specific DNA recombinase
MPTSTSQRPFVKAAMAPAKRTAPSKGHSGKGQAVGYVRVSSAGQNEARQLDGLHLDKTFTDKASGKDTERPQLKALLEFVRGGDHVLVHSMDRLARSLRDLEGVVKGLTARGVAVTFTTQGLTFTGDDSPMNTLLLQLLGAVGQFERTLILERQREGIAIAKSKGVYKGRKPSLDTAGIERLQAMVEADVPKAQIARELGISRTTLYANL